MLGTTTTTITTTTTTTLEQMLLSRHSHQIVQSNLTAMTELPMNLAGEASQPRAPPTPTPVFDPTVCLFCNATSPTLDDNYRHMYKHHGLFVPDKEHLIVDLETLLEYLHLVVFTYRECLFCNTARRTPQAVQQHMMGTGHCKFDIAHEESEFRDFYDFDSDDGAAGDDDEESEEDAAEVEEKNEDEDESLPAENSKAAVQVDESSIRLPSGKIVSNRTAPAPRHPSRQPLKVPASRARSQLISTPAEQPASSEAADDSPSSSRAASSSRALEKKDRQASSLAARLANMRANDQRALAHLPLPEQRALLTQALRQEARADRSKRHFQGRMDSYGNLKSKERFVNDVPGGKSHKNRFFAQ
jgi:pre-60S factor REI1